METTFDFIFFDCFERSGILYSLEDKLALLELENLHHLENRPERYPIRLTMSTLMLVVCGEMRISVDYLPYTIKKDMVMQLSKDNLIENITYSSDFKGYKLLFSPELQSEMMAHTSAVRLPNSIQLRRSYPIHELTEAESIIILNRIVCIRKYILDEAHFYRSSIIKNEVVGIQFELDNSRRKMYRKEEIKTTRNEKIREQFLELLLQKCKEHHDVSFYAGELCVTSDYLSRVVREYDGQSAMKWITNAVVTEAKILLRQPDKSINQLAVDLNFPDQSTFGKFFKRYVGVSPAEYRKNMSPFVTEAIYL